MTLPCFSRAWEEHKAIELRAWAGETRVGGEAGFGHRCNREEKGTLGRMDSISTLRGSTSNRVMAWWYLDTCWPFSAYSFALEPLHHQAWLLLYSSEAWLPLATGWIGSHLTSSSEVSGNKPQGLRPQNGCSWKGPQRSSSSHTPSGWGVRNSPNLIFSCYSTRL